MPNSPLAGLTAKTAGAAALLYGAVSPYSSGDDRKVAMTAAGAVLLEAADAAAQRSALVLGTLATQSGTFSGTSSGTNTGDQDLSTLLVKANNLSDLANAGTARTNLGLGTIATQAAAAVAITGGTLAGLTGLGIRSTGAAFDLTLATSEVLTAGRTLSLVLGDAARTLTLSGNPSLSGVTITGAGTIATGGFTLTVPATGTAALLGTANAFTAAQTYTLGTNTATPLVGNTLINSSAATVGVQSASPSLVWTGQGWKTNATAGSQTVNYQAYVLPVQGAANPTSKWVLQAQNNGGGYFDTINVSRASTTANTVLGFQGNGAVATIAAGAGDAFAFSGGFAANLVFALGNSPSIVFDRGGGGLKIGSASTFGTAIVRNQDGTPALAWLYPRANDVLSLRNSTTAQTLEIYGTGDAYGTDTNYVRASFAVTSTTFTIAAQSAGTGAANIDITLAPKGTGNVSFPGGTLLKTAAALTDGAAAQIGSLTNAPTAGNPTKWVPINDNGTTRYIPTW